MPVDWSDRLEFFDFNKTTGVVSNPLTVNVTDDSPPEFLRKYGVYFYLLNGVMLGGTKVKKQGFITLLRGD